MTIEAVQAGYEFNVYYKDTTWKEIVSAQDVDIQDTYEMLDAPMRGDPVKRSIPGMMDGDITFTLLDTGNGTDVAFLHAAALAKDPVEIAWTKDPIATAGTVYRRDWFYVRMEKTSPIAGIDAYNVTCKPAVYKSAGVQVARSTVTAS